MRVDSALLCDAATIREGLLHVLGGGVTRANRMGFPSPVDLTLALRILVHPSEAERPHELVVMLQSGDGDKLAEFQITFGIDGLDGLEPGEHASVPLALKVPQSVLMPAAGLYSFELLIDGVHQATVPFNAVQLPEGGDTDAGEQHEPDGEPDDS